MAGFTFAYRMSGGSPTIIDIISADTSLHKGDIVNLESGNADLGATNDSAFLGVVLETNEDLNGTTDRVAVIVDRDAVYSVEDPNARLLGATLDLTGSTGAQGVTATSNADFIVVAESTADEPTLVMFTVGNHWLD